MLVLKKFSLISLLIYLSLTTLNECSTLADLIRNNGLSPKNKLENGNDLNYDMGNTEMLDTSVFGNTYESFFDFANRRTLEIESRNKDLYEKSMKACIYTPYVNNTSEFSSKYNDNNNEYRILEDSYTNNNSGTKASALTLAPPITSTTAYSSSALEDCVVAVLNMIDHGKTSDRLFQFDSETIGLISSSDSSLRLFNFNALHATLTSVRVKYFKNERPYDACADNHKNVYVVFPDENKIGKYHINQGFITLKNIQNSKQLNKSRIGIKELISIKDIDLNPTGIACHDNLIYISEKLENQIRVYDKNLRLTRIITLSGIVTSPHHALAVNENTRVLLDGMDSVGLFDPQLNTFKNFLSSKKYNLMQNDENKINVCHFYTNKNCLEDIHLSNAAEANTKTNIFVADSCDNDIKKFLFSKDERMQLSKRYRIPSGKPVSMVTMPSGHMLVLTHSPRKIYVLDTKNCR